MVILSIAALAVAACGGGDGGSSGTGPTPPDRLSIEIQGGGLGTFTIPLDCAIADRDACAGIINALGRADDDPTCRATPDDGGRITVTGTLNGKKIESIVRRRTDCETRVYDDVVASLARLSGD